MLRITFVAALTLACVSVSAEARPRQITVHPECNITMPCEGVSRSARGERIARAVGFGTAQNIYEPHRTTILPHPAGCPRRAFCGCGAAVEVFGRPIRSLWLARNWLRFPRTSPARDMVAARPGHVFVIKQVLGNGKVLAYDANSGGRRTRLHVRSLAGFVVVNPHSSML